MMPASQPTSTADVPPVWLRRPGTRRLEDRVVDENVRQQRCRASICQRFSVLIAYRRFVQWTNVSSTWMPPRNKCTIGCIMDGAAAYRGRLAEPAAAKPPKRLWTNSAYGGLVCPFPACSDRALAEQRARKYFRLVMIEFRLPYTSYGASLNIQYLSWMEHGAVRRPAA
jgi:hypothetical protein